MEYQDTLMWQELCSAPGILKDIEAKNAQTLKAVAKAVKDADIYNIYTAARGTSDHAMIYFKYLAECILGLPVASGAPSVFTMYDAKVDFSHSLVIGCSQSGKAADVAEVIKAANENGGITVAITNDENSPLAELARFHLCCFAGEEKSVAATKTFTCQLMLSLLLVNAIKGKAAQNIGDELTEILPAVDSVSDKFANDLSKVRECFVLSRGITSAIAYECALKLQETSYILARAYHSSDFYHGPMAMVDWGTSVILFASKNSLSNDSEITHMQDYVACAKKMDELGANLYIVTDNAEAFNDINAQIAQVPELGNEALQVMVFALFAQMLACKVSVKKGRNPDNPRALKKVTITK